MKRNLSFLTIVCFGFSLIVFGQDSEYEIPPPPPRMKVPPDPYLESDFGFRIHPNIEKVISKDGKMPIYYIANLIPIGTEKYKYLYLQLGIFDGHFGHFGLIVRDKIENREWEEVEILNSTWEIVEGLKKPRNGHYLKAGDIDIDSMWADEIRKIEKYNKSLEEIPSTSR